MAAPERVLSIPASYSLWQLVRYFLFLGTLGFGGPVALVGYMRRDLVENRGWISEADYKEGLAIVPIRLFRKYGKRPDVSAFVAGVTAAATGAISGAVVVLGRRTLVDLPAVVLAVVTLGILWRWKQVPEPVIVLGAALIGGLLYPLLHH